MNGTPLSGERPFDADNHYYEALDAFKAEAERTAKHVGKESKGDDQ